MSKKLLTVVIEELIVDKSNGDLPDAKPSDDADDNLKNNALTASLRYPRSGAPQVTSTKQYDLTVGTAATLLDPKHPDNFFDPLLFREEVIDSTSLSLKITDRDAEGDIDKLLISLFATVLGAGFSAATSGLTAVLGAITGFGISHLKDDISDAGKDRIVCIGEADPISLVMDDLSANPVRVDLRLSAPVDVVKPRVVIDPVTHETSRQDVVLLKKGDANGHVTLRISAVPI